MPEQPVAVGGQAVVEGVMMRAPTATSVAVRRPDGSIVVRVRAASRLAARHPWVGRPGMRGIAVLVETLADGISALNFSAEQAMPAPPAGAGAPARGGRGERVAIIATLAFSLAFGFFMFAVLPHLLTFGLGWLTGNEDLEGGTAMVFHLVDGIAKALIFLGFVWAMSRVKDMRRVFEYHGAEHQAVHAFEAGIEPVPENLSRFPTEHPRCGTAFLVTVIVVSIFVFAGVFPAMPPLSESKLLNQVLYIAIKLPLILPIAALSYEVSRLAARSAGGLLGRAVSAPGVWFQHITTKPPDRGQQEVASVAIHAALRPELAAVGPANPEAIVPFADFDQFKAWIAGPGGQK